MWIKHLFWDMTLLRPSLFLRTSGTNPSNDPAKFFLDVSTHVRRDHYVVETSVNKE
jgi:hypothetical protein